MSQRSPTIAKSVRGSSDSGSEEYATPRPLVVAHHRLHPPNHATRLQGFEETDRLRVCVALLRNLSATLERQGDTAAMRGLIEQYAAVAYRELSPTLRRLLAEQTGLALPPPYVEDNATLAQWGAQGLVDLDEERRRLSAIEASPIQDEAVHTLEEGWLLCTPLRSLSHYYDFVLDMRFDQRVQHPWAALLQWYFETHSATLATPTAQRALFRRGIDQPLQWVALHLMDLRFVRQDAMASPFVSATLRPAADRPLVFHIYAADMSERTRQIAALRGLMRMDAFAKGCAQLQLWAYSLRLIYHMQLIKRTHMDTIEDAIKASHARIAAAHAEDYASAQSGVAIAEMQTLSDMKRLLEHTRTYYTTIEASRPHYQAPNDPNDPHASPAYIDARILAPPEDSDPFLTEVLTLGMHLERHLSVQLPVNDSGDMCVFYHFPIVCLGQINLLIIEQKQAFHPWSRFFAWFLRYTSQMPQAYRTRLENEGYRSQTLTVTEALTIVFEPYDRAVYLRHAVKGACLASETLELYHFDPAVRRANEHRLMGSVIQALTPDQ